MSGESQVKVESQMLSDKKLDIGGCKTCQYLNGLDIGSNFIVIKFCKLESIIANF